jgi:hypothetical protein
MLSLLSGAISVGGATVGVMVGVAVGGALVGVAGSIVCVGDTAFGDEIIAGVTGVGSGGVDVGEQAVMRIAARVSTMIRLLGFVINHLQFTVGISPIRS